MSADPQNLAKLTGIDVAGDLGAAPAKAEAGGDTNVRPRGPRREPWEDEILTLRMLITQPTAAGAVIGKAGGVISAIREDCDVRAGVSKAVTGVVDRILTVSGHVDGVAKAYGLFAENLLDNQNQLAEHNGEAHSHNITLRFLVGHSLMGSIIGKGGAKIKDIQEKSGARLAAGKDMLPQSTERTIDVTGAPTEQIETAVKLILQAVLDDLRRGGRERWMVVQGGLVLYQPGGRAIAGEREHRGDRRESFGAAEGSGEGRRRNEHAEGGRRRQSTSEAARHSHNEYHPQPAAEGEQTQTLTVPSDLVGCIIGRGGAQIASIRRESQARISISREPIGAGRERLFTISGSPEANTRALELIYAALENEKARRENAAADADA